MKKLLQIFLILFLCQNVILAQNINDTIFIEEVTITKYKTLNKTGLTYTKIDSIIFKNNTEQDLSTVLSAFSPIFIKNYGSGGLTSASFRGTAASHTKVFWNDINIASPMLGQVDFSLIPMFFIDDIQLFHGSSSLSQNTGALGGSVNLQNKPDWSNKFSTTIIQQLASFNTYSTFASLSVGNKKFQSKTKLFYNYSKNNYKYLNSTDPAQNWEQLQNADFQKYGFLQELHFRIKQNSFFSFVLWSQISRRNIPAIMSYKGIHRDELQDNKQTRMSLSFNKKFNKIYLKISSGYSLDKIHYFLADSTNNGVGNDQAYFIKSNTSAFMHSLNNKAKFDYKYNLKTEFAVSLFYNFYSVNTFDSASYSMNKYNANRHESKIKASFHKKINNHFSFFVLAYLNYTDKKLLPIIPSVGLEYKLFKKTDLYLKSNISRNYHLPTLNDLYWLPGGNPDLVPEIGYSGDIGLDFTKKIKNVQISSSISIYASLIDDWIIWRPSESVYWTAQNLKKVFARGIEYSFNLNGNFRKIKYQLIGNYAFTKTTNQSSLSNNDLSLGKQLIYIPLHTFNVFSNINYKHFYTNSTLSFTDQRFTTSSNLENRHILPSYYLINISVGKRFNFDKFNFELKFKVENIFNKQYQAVLYRAMPGRNYSFVVRFKFL